MTDVVTDTTAQDAQATQDVDSTTDVLDTSASEISKEKVEEILSQKRRANKEAQDAKKKLVELEAKVKEFEDKDKAEIDKAKERAANAERTLRDMEHQLDMERRTKQALVSGVSEQYAEYVASEYARTVSDNPDLNAKDFFSNFKKTHPAFFGQSAQPKPTAEGGPTTGKPDRMADLETRKKELMSQPRNHKIDSELYRLNLELSRLKAASNSA